MTLQELEHVIAQRAFHLNCFREYSRQHIAKIRELMDTPLVCFKKRIQLIREARELEDLANGHENEFKHLSNIR